MSHVRDPVGRQPLYRLAMTLGWGLAGLRRLAAASAVVTLLSATSAAGAPLPPFEPVDVCGSVGLVAWLEPSYLPPVPGMSGSAGHGRKWPGRFVVVLSEVGGISGAQVGQINGLLRSARDASALSGAPGDLLLVLPHRDPGALRAGVRLCVYGFRISGDEGGTWTDYDSLEIVGRNGDVRKHLVDRSADRFNTGEPPREPIGHSRIRHRTGVG